MKYVSYYRVSTSRQGKSGLGLGGQKEAVHRHLKEDAQIVGEFIEVESGRHSNRPKLNEAIQACKAWKAKLIIAKLDRLSRNVAFISSLMESGVEFVAVDFPDANRLTLHILAAVAEHEAICISARTKEALACAKSRGKRLGGHRGSTPSDSCRRLGVASVRKSANERLLAVWPVIQPLLGEGHMPPARIAKFLNLRGIPTLGEGGKGWQTVQVSRMLAHASRLGLLGAEPLR
ncbi:recombinase family protein [Aquabacter cavernae]|uniref:recombinase family protein n=1 Tax=Aquabacter cavernae TaxID=2496029 RepID=UPI001FE02592|nr:recombinase family protein [Aquabacter cavernae]